MASGGQIKKLNTKDQLALRIGNEVEHCSLVYDVPTDKVSVMVITIHGSGMLSFTPEDFMNFLTPFLVGLQAKRPRIVPE